MLSSTLALFALAFNALCAVSAPVSPVTYYSIEYQDQLVKNAARIGSKPYAKYFDPELFFANEAIAPARKAINCNTQALKQDLSDVNKLLAPASTQLVGEDGWCAYADGGGYVASRTHWPGVTAEMITWWFWWHSAESERYSLWHPWAHVSLSSTAAPILDNPNLNNTQKYIGATHHITEIIGNIQQAIDITFVRPADIGIDESKFKENGIVASACGQIFFQGTPLRIATMYHLWYETEGGLELRSRYFLGNNVELSTKLGVLGSFIPINAIASFFGIKNQIAGRPLSFQQFSHDQQEFTHLAAFLPKIFKEFGQLSKVTV